MGNVLLLDLAGKGKEKYYHAINNMKSTRINIETVYNLVVWMDTSWIYNYK